MANTAKLYQDGGNMLLLHQSWKLYHQKKMVFTKLPATAKDLLKYRLT
jgi:hypothetical protein